MHENYHLEKLTVSELYLLLGHIKLGVTHLQKHLTEKQLTQLLAHGPIESTQFQKIKADETEKHGNIILMVNTVFTCVIGGWLASIGFMGLKSTMNEYVLLVLLAAAAISSGYFGYISFKKVRTEATDAINKQKLANLQLKLLSLIKTQKESQIAKLARDVDKLTQRLSQFHSSGTPIGSLNSLKTKEGFGKWFNELSNTIEEKIYPLAEKEIYRVFIKNLKKLKTKFEKAIEENAGLTEHYTQAESEQAESKPNQNAKQQTSDENSNQSFIPILIDPMMTVPKADVKKKLWLKTNMYSLLNGLIPTIMGGFCSLFIYFSGIPDVLKEFGTQSLDDFISRPFAFFLVLAITLCFGFFFVYGNRKSFLREQEYEKTQKIITNKELELLALTSRRNLFKKVKKYVEDTVRTLSFVGHVSQNLALIDRYQDVRPN